MLIRADDDGGTDRDRFERWMFLAREFQAVQVGGREESNRSVQTFTGVDAKVTISLQY